MSSFSQGFIISFIPILSAIQLLNLWHIYVLGFIIASIGSFYSVINSTVIPQLFSKEQLTKVNSIFQFIDTFSLLIGSALAGILIGYIGVFNVFIVNSISFILISITILFLKQKNKQKRVENNSTSLKQLKEGVKYLLNHPALGPLTFLTLVVNIANGALISMLVYFARNKLYLTSEEIGWVYSASAISQILVIFIFAYIGNRESTAKLMLTSLLISSTGIVIVAFSWDWISLALGIAIQSAPVILFNLLNMTLRQKIVPTNIFGRVNGK